MGWRYILSYKTLRNSDIKVQNTCAVSCLGIISAFSSCSYSPGPMTTASQKKNKTIWRRKYTSPFPNSSSLDPPEKQTDLPSKNILFSLLIFTLSVNTHTWRYISQPFMPLSSLVLDNQCFNCPSNSVSHYYFEEDISLPSVEHHGLQSVFLGLKKLWSAILNCILSIFCSSSFCGTRYLHLLLGKKKVHSEAGSIPVKTNLYLLLPIIQDHQYQ